MTLYLKLFSEFFLINLAITIKEFLVRAGRKFIFNSLSDVIIHHVNASIKIFFMIKTVKKKKNFRHLFATASLFILRGHFRRRRWAAAAALHLYSGYYITPAPYVQECSAKNCSCAPYRHIWGGVIRGGFMV